jgi:hypothetical protein
LRNYTKQKNDKNQKHILIDNEGNVISFKENGQSILKMLHHNNCLPYHVRQVIVKNTMSIEKLLLQLFRFLFRFFFHVNI